MTFLVDQWFSTFFQFVETLHCRKFFRRAFRYILQTNVLILQIDSNFFKAHKMLLSWEPLFSILNDKKSGFFCERRLKEWKPRHDGLANHVLFMKWRKKCEKQN
jgi:hypothetical protein